MTIYAEQNALRNKFYAQGNFSPEWRGIDSCIVDFNSIGRNGLAATPVASACALAINVSLLGAGILGLPIGLSGTRDNFLLGKFALKNKDYEGAGHHALTGTAFATYGGVSGVVGAMGIMALKGKTITNPLTHAVPGLCVPLYAALGAMGTYGLYQSRAFGKELKGIKGYEKKFEWIVKQLTLTDEELKGKNRELALQKKWGAFERRTSVACARNVRQALLQGEVKPNLQKILVKEVEKANFMAQVKYGLFVLIALVGLAASIVLIMNPFGLAFVTASCLLFAICSATWLTVDSVGFHQFIGERLWKFSLPAIERV
jgi:hypothetical protein